MSHKVYNLEQLVSIKLKDKEKSNFIYVERKPSFWSRGGVKRVLDAILTSVNYIHLN